MRKSEYSLLLIVTTLLSWVILTAVADAFGVGPFWAVFGAVLYYMVVRKALKRFVISSSVPSESEKGLSCSGCGFSVSKKGILKPLRRSKEVYCPSCYNKQIAKDNRAGFIFVLVMFPVSIGLVLLKPENIDAWIPAWLMATYFSLILFIMPHELGHALVGRLLGGRVFSIIIGTGGRLGNVRVMGLDVEFNSIPLGGITRVIFRRPDWYRAKAFLMLIAGPMVHVIAILAVVLVSEPDIYLRPFRELGLNLPSVLFYSNALLLASSLIPRAVGTHLGLLGTDGMQMFQIHKITDEQIKIIGQTYYTLEGLTLIRNGRLEEARRWYEEGLTNFPDNVINTNDMGLYHLYNKDYENARQWFKLALERLGDKSNLLYHILINNIAYSSLLLGGEGNLEEADRLSEEAYNLAGWKPELRGTRGAVLVEKGRIEEGISYLKSSLEMSNDPATGASTACHLALAYIKKHETSTAREHLETARRLDPNCPLIETVKEKLESPRRTSDAGR